MIETRTQDEDILNILNKIWRSDLGVSSLVVLGSKHVINCPHHLRTMMMMRGMMMVMTTVMTTVVVMMVVTTMVVMMNVPVSFQQVQ